MPFLTPDDVLDLRIDMIRKQFPSVNIEFSRQVFEQHLELWVYVLDQTQLDAVRKYCNEVLDALDVDPSFGSVWTIVQYWKGPWPGGEPDPNWEADRKNALERLRKRREQLQLH